MLRTLLNPWVLLGASLAMASAFGYGLKLGNDRLESYIVAAKAVGELAEERRKNVIEKQKALKKETENEIQKALALLAKQSADAIRLLDSRPRSRIVSTPKPSPERVQDTRYCADAEGLNKRIDADIRAAEKAALGVLQSIGKDATVGRICAAWAIKQETRTP